MESSSKSAPTSQAVPPYLHRDVPLDIHPCGLYHEDHPRVVRKDRRRTYMSLLRSGQTPLISFECSCRPRPAALTLYNEDIRVHRSAHGHWALDNAPLDAVTLCCKSGNSIRRCVVNVMSTCMSIVFFTCLHLRFGTLPVVPEAIKLASLLSFRV